MSKYWQVKIAKMMSLNNLLNILKDFKFTVLENLVAEQQFRISWNSQEKVETDIAQCIKTQHRVIDMAKRDLQQQIDTLMDKI